MDFVSDSLIDGRRLRALTVVDAFTREALAIDVDQGIKGEQVVEAMARISSIRGAPRPFVWTMDRSSSRRQSTVGVRERRDAGFQPDRANRPRQCVRRIVQRSPSRRVPERTLVPVHRRRPRQDRGWRRDYNESRPHTSLGWMTPVEYAAAAAIKAAE